MLIILSLSPYLSYAREQKTTETDLNSEEVYVFWDGNKWTMTRRRRKHFESQESTKSDRKSNNAPWMNNSDKIDNFSWPCPMNIQSQILS